MLYQIITIAQNTMGAFIQLSQWITQPIWNSLSGTGQAIWLAVQTGLDLIGLHQLEPIIESIAFQSPAQMLTTFSTISTILSIGIIRWILDILP